MLAEASEPLILADGTKIDPSSGTVIRDKKYSVMVEVPAGRDAQAIVAKARRSAAELPFQPGQMNVVSLVLLYTMWGLSASEAAMQIGITAKQVRNIQELDEYKTISEDIRKSVLEYQANDVRSMMMQHAMGAANKVVDLMEEEGALGFAAARDVLDRTGHRPADVVEHRHKMEDTLRIEIVERKAAPDIPDVLNVTDFHEVN